MKVETLLPLGKIDPGLRAADTPMDIARVAEDARLVEEIGYDGLVTEETKDDPYVIMALAAQATPRGSSSRPVSRWRFRAARPLRR